MVISDWVVDYIYRIKGIAAFRRKPPKHYQHNKSAGKTPVILLSGFSLGWHFMGHLGNRISYAGHPVYVIPNLRRNWINLPESAKFVREVIDEHDLKNLIIVAHSKGGLIGKYLLVHHNQDKRIKKVVAIATPFYGTRLARIIPHRLFHEMTPEGKIIQQLQLQTDVNKKIISLIPEYDNIVWSDQGSYLKGAKNIHVKVRGHHRILFAKEVEDVIMYVLKET